MSCCFRRDKRKSIPRSEALTAVNEEYMQWSSQERLNDSLRQNKSRSTNGIVAAPSQDNVYSEVRKDAPTPAQAPNNKPNKQPKPPPPPKLPKPPHHHQPPQMNDTPPPSPPSSSAGGSGSPNGTPNPNGTPKGGVEEASNDPTYATLDPTYLSQPSAIPKSAPTPRPPPPPVPKPANSNIGLVEASGGGGGADDSGNVIYSDIIGVLRPESGVNDD